MASFRSFGKYTIAFRRVGWLGFVGIALVGVLSYANTLYSPFVFDDFPVIVENPALRSFGNLWPPDSTRWFGLLTFAVNYRLGGLDVFGYHAANLAIHIVNGLLLYGIVVFSLRTPYFTCIAGDSEDIRSNTLLLPVLCALVFVSHPIQTQAVTYVCQRFTSLATLFYLLAVYSYARFRIDFERCRSTEPTGDFSGNDNVTTTGGLFKRSAIAKNVVNKKKRYVLGMYYVVAVLSSCLGMMTKEITVTLPIMLCVFEFAFMLPQARRDHMARLAFLVPFFLAAFTIPLQMMGHYQGIEGIASFLRDPRQLTGAEISGRDYLITQIPVMLTYIRLMVLPVHQNLDYDYPIYHTLLNSNVVVASIFLLVCIGIAIFFFVRSKNNRSVLRLAAFGIIWFFVAISVESSLIPLQDVIFEHRLYLPGCGLIMAIISCISCLIMRFIGPRYRSIFMVSAFSLIVIVLLVMTYQRNSVWGDVVHLWEDVVAKSPNKAHAHASLGYACYGKGLKSKAMEEFQTAVNLKSDFSEAYNGLGTIYKENGSTEAALNCFLLALQGKFARGSDRANAYNNIGVIYYEKKRPEEAIKYFEQSLKINPGNKDILFNSGVIHFEMKNFDIALKEFREVLKINPDDREATRYLERMEMVKREKISAGALTAPATGR